MGGITACLKSAKSFIRALICYRKIKINQKNKIISKNKNKKLLKSKIIIITKQLKIMKTCKTHALYEDFQA